MDDGETPKRTPSSRAPEPWAEFGGRLRHWRRSLGLTQAQLGARVGYDHSAISKLESGVRQPLPPLVRRLDEVLGAGGELVAVWTAVAEARSCATAAGVLRAAPLPGEGAARGTGPAVPDGLVWPSRLPSYAMTCPLHGGEGCAVPPLEEASALHGAFRAPGAPPGAGADTVHVLAGLLAVYERAGDERPSPALAAEVEHTLHAIVRRLETAGCREPARRALLRLAAAYAELAGELRMLHGQNGLAMAWFDKGVRWAAACGDSAMRVALLIDMSTLAKLENDAPSALAYARAIREAAPGRHWADTMAHLCEARGHTLGGDIRQCLRHIALARDGLDRFGERDTAEVPWLATFPGPVRVESGAAGALRDIAAMTSDRSAARLAVEAARTSLDRLGPRTRPTRLLFTLRLADGHACAGDLEAAMAVAGPVLAEASAASSVMVGRELRGLRDRLVARWSGRPEVDDLAARLADGLS